MRRAKILVLLLVSVLVLSIAAVVSANSNDIEKIVFVHYKKGHEKSADIPAGLAVGKPVNCYKLLRGEWRTTPVNYVINPANPQGLSEAFITSAIYAGAEEWDAHTSKELFGTYSINYTIMYGVQDYKNALTFEDLPDTGVIGMASVWISRAKKEIVEFDVVFNTDYTWGDASVSNVTVMDLENIATHEIGHGVGLDDLYNTVCTEETMYGYSTWGEVKKRTLNAGDITGIQRLYGA